MHFVPIDVQKHQKYVLPFRRDSFIVSFGTDKGLGDEKEYLEWLLVKSRQFPEGFVLVLENDIPIGQVELTIKEYKGKVIGYVNLYYLVPEKRKLGFGKKLHQYAMTFFNKNGVSEYHLRVSPNNSTALAFYKNMGMEELYTEFDGSVIRMKGNI
ncbi:GNAT family N-acetyltransferase [Bacillus spongiae]|uniref:GNAT family N-acetyltransferase n=1 Tax=Bacillus spongiae TaxID=2683610 RepID=A0ABU8HCA8_9BACI